MMKDTEKKKREEEEEESRSKLQKVKETTKPIVRKAGVEPQASNLPAPKALRTTPVPRQPRSLGNSPEKKEEKKRKEGGEEKKTDVPNIQSAQQFTETKSKEEEENSECTVRSFHCYYKSAESNDTICKEAPCGQLKKTNSLYCKHHQRMIENYTYPGTNFRGIIPQKDSSIQLEEQYNIMNKAYNTTLDDWANRVETLRIDLKSERMRLDRLKNQLEYVLLDYISDISNLQTEQVNAESEDEQLQQQLLQKRSAIADLVQRIAKLEEQETLCQNIQMNLEDLTSASYDIYKDIAY